MKAGIGYSHGKIILIGEHAAVYGKPAIAIPFLATKCKTVVKETLESNIDSIVYRGKTSNAPEELTPITSLIKELTIKLDLPNLSFDIKSNIPISSGMGSSAAVASSIVQAVYDYLEKDLSPKDKLSWIEFSEIKAHGNPSGIDALTTTFNNAWLFQKGSLLVEFDSNLAAYLIVGQSGEKGNTKEAVSIVKEEVDKGKMNLIEELGRLTQVVYEAYLAEDIILIGKTLTAAQKILKELQVSTEKIDQMVELALSNRALGAKLTGGGLGGCVIALAKNYREAENIKMVWENLSTLEAWILDLSEEKK